MKYFIFLIAFFICANSFCQDQTLYINNDTSCTLDYTVFAYVVGTDCEDDQYQLKVPLTSTPGLDVLNQGFAIYGVGSTEWYDYSTTPPSVVLDTSIDDAGIRFSGFKIVDGAIISISDCGGSSTDSDTCNSTGFTATIGSFGSDKLVNLVD